MTGRTVQTMVFRFPMPPRVMNGGHGSWQAAAAMKKTFYRLCDERQKYGLLPAPPKTPFTSVVLSAVMYLGNAMDDENAFARASKFPLDWLKTRGYIVDDRKQNIRWAGLPEQDVRRGQEYVVELTLTSETA